MVKMNSCTIWDWIILSNIEYNKSQQQKGIKYNNR